MENRALFFPLICLAVLLTASQCRKPVDPPVIVPCFTIVPDTYRDPRDPVQFQNCSQGADTYLWEFGDGTTSTEVNPAHTYTTMGAYTVGLTAIKGDYDESTYQDFGIDYPSITKVRVLRLPVLNGDGLPLDPDGSGLELRMVFYKMGVHGPVNITPTTQNATLPVDLTLVQPLDTYSNSITFILQCLGSGSTDTISYSNFSFGDFINGPVTSYVTDSLEYEVYCEGYL